MTSYLIAFGLGAVLIGYVLWRFARAVRSHADAQAKAEKAEAYEAELKKIEDAANAGHAVRPDDSVRDDPNNRDNWGV